MKFLVIDDELVSRNKMEKILGTFGQCVAVDSGEAALSEIATALDSEEPFDVITLDISMPGMDGTEVLYEIRRMEDQRKITEEGRTKIVVVTGHSDRDTVITAIQAGCDTYVVKPFDRAIMAARFEEMDIRGPVFDEEEPNIRGMVMKTIDRFNQGKISLPVFPEIVDEIELFMNKPGAGIKELAKIIEKDMVIAARVVATANSTFYRGVEKVHDLRSAIARLGSQEIRNIVCVIATSHLYRTRNRLCGTLLKKLWLHSLCCAYGCRAIASRLGEREADKVFLMGLTHNIGTVLLLRSIGDMVSDSILYSKNELMDALLEVQAGFGAAILKDMGFGNDFTDVVWFHGWKSFGEETPRVVLIVNLARNVATQLGYGFFENGVDMSDLTSAKMLGIDNELIAGVAEEVRQGMQDADRVFG